MVFENFILIRRMVSNRDVQHEKENSRNGNYYDRRGKFNQELHINNIDKNKKVFYL